MINPKDLENMDMEEIKEIVDPELLAELSDGREEGETDEE